MDVFEAAAADNYRGRLAAVAADDTLFVAAVQNAAVVVAGHNSAWWEVQTSASAAVGVDTTAAVVQTSHSTIVAVDNYSQTAVETVVAAEEAQTSPQSAPSPSVFQTSR
jgi:hypothetical protein